MTPTLLMSRAMPASLSDPVRSPARVGAGAAGRHGGGGTLSPVILGLLGALSAAVCYGAATVLQAVGVRRLADAPPSLGLLARAWAGRLYAVGLALDGLGFAASVLALRSLPLFVVQSAVASGLAVTAVLGVWVLRAGLSGREIVALAVIAAGLLALAASASEGPATRLDGAGPWLVLLGLVPVLVLTGLGLATPRRSAASSGLLAAAAGLGFGGVGIAARVIEVPLPWWHVVGDPLGWALVGYALASLACYGLALERGHVTAVAAVTVGMETVVPAAVGLLWLGDAVRPGFVLVCALGFLATLGGCLVLAGRAEVPAQASTPVRR